MKEVAGEGAIASHHCQSAPQLPAMPSFIFPPRDNSLSKFGSMGVSNQPGDFSGNLTEVVGVWICPVVMNCRLFFFVSNGLVDSIVSAAGH